ncbi:metallophosphoesterase family protein [Pseudactinotalea sp. Z1748]|uniref:metallophosphoesterase family protein n=1 Tax=Pseudactinotalea sp. Z1748 TaxID=3413027 RepID=UPI003C7A3585
MAGVWFTSDLHLGHRFVASLRIGTTREEVDLGAYHEQVIEQWNDCVRPGDVVWNLGDVTLAGPERVGPVLQRLNGTQHLVAGNHDRVHPMFRDAHKVQRQWLDYFASVQAHARRRIDGYSVLLSHFPYRGEGQRHMADRHTQYRLPNKGVPLIHGHTHDEGQKLSFDAGTPMVHVGWDAWGRPVHLDEVSELLAIA